MNALGQFRAILLTVAVAVLAALASPPQANAQSPGYVKLSQADLQTAQPIDLGVNKSVVVDLPWPVSDVLVSDPKIADAVLRTSTRLYLIGVKFGQASVFLFDASGNQIASLNLYVEVDLTVLNQLLSEAISDGYVRAEALNGSIVLRGQVGSSTDAGKAVEITRKMISANPTWIYSSNTTGSGAGSATQSSAQQFSPDDLPGVVNLLTITGEEQVALKVSVVEVQRSVAKQLGVNLKGVFLDGTSWGIGTNLSSALGTVASGVGGSPITFPFNSANTPAEVGGAYSDGTNTVQGTIQALEETRMLRTLAEPTLTAVSGETANFLAGGEFPVPVAGDNGTISVAFKQFGVNLAFTPVVLSGGRISLKMRSEVSDISATGAVSVPISTNATVTIPATTVRRAETSIELPSGGSFMVAGLIQENTRRAISGMPWLQKLPILGTLFSSKDFLSDQSELMMIVTAYLVKPVAPGKLARPDDNLFLANDAEAYFLNRLTKVYGSKSQVPHGAASNVGFTFD